MQPKQCLLLHRGWIPCESTANEAKHLLHGERERAKFNVKHFAEKQNKNIASLSYHGKHFVRYNRKFAERQFHYQHW